MEILTFEYLLNRADTEILTMLLGVKVVQLLTNIDEDYVKPSALRKALLKTYSKTDLLSDYSSRSLLFDLLTFEEARVLCLELELNPASPFFELSQLKKLLPRQKTNLFSFFGIASPSLSDANNSIAKHQISPRYALFDHQNDAISKINTKLNTYPYRAILHMPTGSGKTRTAMSYLCEYAVQNKSQIIIWLASSEELCEQAACEFEKAWSFKGSYPINLFRLWGGLSYDMESVRSGIIITNFQTLYARYQKHHTWCQIHLPSIGLLIVDEAHQSIAETYLLVIDGLSCKNPQCKVLGLTATPGRTWNDSYEDQLLAEFYGENKVILTVKGYDNPIEYLIENRYLSKPRFRHILSESNWKNSTHNILFNPKGALSDELKKRLSEDTTRNQLILSKLGELVQKHSRIIVFATSVEHAEILTSVANTIGYQARCVNSKVDRTSRKKILEWYLYESDDSRILINYNILTTGFDAPKTSAVLIARPTKSLVLYSQMVGRALRGEKVGGHSHADILTVVDTAVSGFGDLTAAFLNWEDIWKES